MTNIVAHALARSPMFLPSEYAGLIAPLVKALREQNARTAELETRCADCIGRGADRSALSRDRVCRGD